MTPQIHGIQPADKSSDKDADTVARRGKIAGKQIVTATIESCDGESVIHSCIVPDGTPIERIAAVVAEDFETSTEPLDGDLDALEERREKASMLARKRARLDAKAKASKGE